MNDSGKDASLVAIKVLFFCLLFTVLSTLALAAENIEIPSDGVKVYSKSDIASPVIGILKKGTVIPAATNPVGNFKKVMIVVSGQKKIGYINLYDMKGEVKVVTALPAPVASPTPAPLEPLPVKPVQKEAAKQPRSKKPVNYGLHNRTAVGLLLGVTYQYQGSRAYSDSSGASNTAGVLTGANFQLGLSVDFPFSYTSSLVPYLLYKPIQVTGTLTPNAGVATAPSAFVLTQNYVSVGALMRFYSGVSSFFWYGVGLQVDHATSGSFQIGNAAAIASQQGDLPNLVMLYGSLGIDFKFSKSFFFCPDLRIGALLNTSPPIYEVSGNASFKLAF